MNDETFKPENCTISSIFSCDGIYKIPNYQRQYSWTDEQLEVLWDDLYESYQNNSNSCYFLGSIVVAKTGDYLELIDGQQRITTLMIMMDVLRKTFPNINSESERINYADVDKITSCILHGGKRNRLQLQSDPNYDTIFNDKIIKCINYDDVKKPKNSQLSSDNPEYKYINTAYFFHERFLSLEPEDLDEFVNYIFFKTNIIKIVCTDESFAIKLFQVLNDRGLELSNSDLVKAEIYGKYEQDDIDGKNSFNATWNKIVDISNRYDFKMDDFMVYYEYFKLKSNPQRQVIDEIKQIIKGVEPEDIMIEMHKFAKSVENVYTATDPCILSLKYIPWKAYVNTAISCAYYVDYDNKAELFDLMRRFFYISFISGGTLNTIKQTSFKLIEYIVDKRPLEDIEEEFNQLISSKKMIRKCYDALDDEVYNEKFLKPLLLAVDYNIREESNTAFYPIDKKLHMDHILPKAYKKKEAWNYIKNRDEADKYLNTIGNMALLLYSKNEEALNCGFKEKMSIYKGEGNSKGGVSAFETTRVIISNAEKNDDYEWDVESIKKRKEFLLGKIEEMLHISRDDIEELLTESEEDNRKSLEKWEYKDKFYNNKGIIKAVLLDYITENNIQEFKSIPEEIRNAKVHSHEVIKTEFTEKEKEMNYSYREEDLNGMSVYMRDYGDTDDTIRFINIMKKYYDFDIFYNSEIEIVDDIKGTITRDMVEAVYDLAKKVYEKEMDSQEAVNKMVEMGMNSNSAYMYIDCFAKMMTGEVYKRGTSRFAAEYYISKIREEYGKEYSKKAIEALEKHINYLEKNGTTNNSLKEVLNNQKLFDELL